MLNSILKHTCTFTHLAVAIQVRSSQYRSSAWTVTLHPARKMAEGVVGTSIRIIFLIFNVLIVVSSLSDSFSKVKVPYKWHSSSLCINVSIVTLG